MSGAYRYLIGLYFIITFLPAGSAQMDQLRLGLTLQPLPLVEFYQGGNLRVGLQGRVAPRLFLHGEFGKYLPFLSYNTSELSGYNWRAELQYNYSAFYYFALSYFYKDHSFTLEDEVANNGLVSQEVYRLQKYANSLTFKWGKLAWMKRKNAYTDIYIGGGLRVRNVQQSGLTDQEFENINSNSIVYRSARKQGQIFSPELCFGFRLGFAVFRKKDP